jgi:hypothetical protein
MLGSGMANADVRDGCRCSKLLLVLLLPADATDSCSDKLRR